MTCLPIIKTCGECMHYCRKGQCMRTVKALFCTDDYSCEHFNAATGLEWQMDCRGDWFLYLHDEYVGLVAQNAQQTQWGAFWSMPGPDFAGTLHDCARALVAAVLGTRAEKSTGIQ